jgi:hypothetical protein
MQSMTDDEAREYCQKFAAPLRIADDDSIYFDVDEELSLLVQSPMGLRGIGFLADALASASPNGGLLWLHLMYGAEPLVTAGFEIIDNMRRANGENRPLRIAPAQNFEANEQLQMQIALMQVIGNGWNGYLIPADHSFLISFRSSHRFFCYGPTKDRLVELSTLLEPWHPKEVAHA